MQQIHFPLTPTLIIQISSSIYPDAYPSSLCPGPPLPPSWSWSGDGVLIILNGLLLGAGTTTVSPWAPPPLTGLISSALGGGPAFEPLDGAEIIVSVSPPPPPLAPATVSMSVFPVRLLPGLGREADGDESSTALVGLGPEENVTSGLHVRPLPLGWAGITITGDSAASPLSCRRLAADRRSRNRSPVSAASTPSRFLTSHLEKLCAGVVALAS